MTLPMRAVLRDTYLASVVLSAIGFFAIEALNPTDEPWNIWGVLLLFVTMAVAERLSVPMRTAQVSVATIPHMVAILLLPVWLAMALSGAAMLLDQLAARAPARKVLFNVASIVLTVGAANLVSDKLGVDRTQLGAADGWQPVLAFLIVAACYYLLTNLLVAIVMSLNGGEPVHRILLDNARFALPAEFGVCGIGGLVAVLWVRSPNWAPLLLFPVITAQAALTYISSSKRSNARLTLLAEASRLLSLSLDPAELASRVARLAVPTLADTCLIYLRGEDGELCLSAVHQAEAAQSDDDQAGADAACASPEMRRWVADIVRTGRPAVGVGQRSFLGVPLANGDRFSGALVCVSSVGARPYGAADVALAHDLARRYAISLDNARLYRAAQAAQEDLRELNEVLERRVYARTLELETTVKHLKGLSDVSRTVTSNLDLAEVLTAIVVRAVDLSGADDGFVYQYDPTSRSLVYRTSCGLSPEAANELEVDHLIQIDAAGAMTYVARSRHTLQLPDVSDHASLMRLELGAVRDIEICLRDGMRAMLVLPMLRGDELAGVLTVRRKTPGTFSPETVELLETFAAQSTLSIQDARMFQQLQDERAALQVANRHKSDFLASMSHELRTPLNAIIGFSQVLLDHGVSEIPEEQRATFVSHIHHSGQHLLGLINDILDLSKVEAGHMELYRERYSLAELIEDCVTMMRVVAASRQIHIEATCQPPDAAVNVDGARVKQIVYNLLSNAVKFTPAGGRVALSAHVSGRDAVVSVSDTGIGIKPEDQQLIFEAFRQ
ncbi:MAG TPA: GAF domain-containing protein, partial [Chloroflexota bacterium]